MKLRVGMRHTPIVQKDEGRKGKAFLVLPPHPLIRHVNRRLLKEGIELSLRRTKSNPPIVTTAVVTSCHFCATSRGTVYCHNTLGRGGGHLEGEGMAIHL